MATGDEETTVYGIPVKLYARKPDTYTPPFPVRDLSDVTIEVIRGHRRTVLGRVTRRRSAWRRFCRSRAVRRVGQLLLG